jgi:hypothetical protein
LGVLAGRDSATLQLLASLAERLQLLAGTPRATLLLGLATGLLVGVQLSEVAGFNVTRS